MRQGEVIASRFEIERMVGLGGMGQVYRARDLTSGEAVAVKVLQEGYSAGDARFAQEAEMLAELHHPGIVRYVAHGTAASGRRYLAMEWLEGEELADRLLREPLSISETIALMTGAAEALAAVHARGIVHRDLKPSNLFLVDRRPGRVKLLDFGIARLPKAAARMTQTGAFIGTPGYMAPEQVRSGQEIDPRADVFALGCLLFECLTGRPAFAGEHFMAVLGKILLDEAPRIKELCPEVPRALDTLCARMLSKDPAARPEDGAAVAAALEGALRGAALPSLLPPPPSAEPPSSALTRSEQRVLSVVLVGPDPLASGEEPPADAETQILSTPADLRDEIAVRGGHLDLMADGSILVTFIRAGVATDQATQAARASLALRARAVHRPMALATGRAEVSGKLPAGALLDRAARMLSHLGPVVRIAAAAGRAPPVAIDEMTFALLDARFEVTEGRDGILLHSEQPLAKGARTLLGKPTACVGRDWEIKTLEAMVVECIEESRSRAVLVTAPAGAGKSRLAYELLRRERIAREPLSVWIGRGDPLRAGAAFGLLGQVLRGACGIQDGEPLAARQAKIRARVGQRVRAEDAPRVAEFLGEILGTPFPEKDSVPLRSARKDAQLMGDQMRLAWIDFLGAACEAEPVIFVLEDLHWADRLTVQFIDEALRRLKERPFLVLGLARPSIHELFPRLWADRCFEEIRLKQLTRKASERLVRQVLGERLSAEVVERLVVQADGNAFYLEELIRAAAEGDGRALPETVLSMVQSRLYGLDSASRRLLRAASVFGEVFWRGAALALLGDDEGGPPLDDQIERLRRQEWIDARPQAKFAGEREFVFRHALVREAAYGMLTDDDRALGHRLAGEWLTRASEPSAAVIAEHFDRGGEPARAAVCYQRAAEAALAGNDFKGALAYAERAMAMGAEGEALGALALIRAEALRWRGENAEAERWALEAMRALGRGSARWYRALSEAAVTATRLGQRGRLEELASELDDAWSPGPTEAPTGPEVVATARMTVHLFQMGLYARAEALHARIEAVAERFGDDPAVGGIVAEARASRAKFVGHLVQSIEQTEIAIACFEREGNLRNACSARANLGIRQALLGAYAEAEEHLSAALVGAERMGLGVTLSAAQANLSLVLCRRGAAGEARALAEEAARAFAARGQQRGEGGSRVYLASILKSTGDLEGAEAEARRAVALLAVARPMQVVARGTLAEVLLARGRADEALAEAREALALLASLGKVEEGEALARLMFAEALCAAGQRAEALAAIAEARDHLLAAAARIDDPRRRESFLGRVPENARTLTLASSWLDAAGT